ncbi:hypothetical protein RchiOBHm_Chr1g0331911 [Rosa chinensis]|uniref:Uncharacterized protein n=1 Tax=Rosa chinensis TaxID=74649 RepID=A0A2P6SBN4_ROSCH|nr:hypothetical protein RchiOBHm_Chr1g0331911 [Rosa chinensis]
MLTRIHNSRNQTKENKRKYEIHRERWMTSLETKNSKILESKQPSRDDPRVDGG